MIKKEELSDGALNMIAGRFRLLSDPTRLKILHTLGAEKMSVTDLVSTTGIGQANVSKHLGILLDAGIVARRKDGLKSIYHVSDETIFELCDTVCSGLRQHYETRQSTLAQNFDAIQ